MKTYVSLDGHPIETTNQIRPSEYIFGSGTVVKMHVTARPDKAMCSGCRDDFYNGHNPLGVSECWSFKDAVVVDKVGHSSIHREGGPDVIKKRTLRCWSGPK